MIRSRFPLAVACSTIHFVCATAFFAWSSSSATSDALEGRAVSWLGLHVAPVATKVLWFPASPLAGWLGTLGYHLPPVGQWAFLFANSALWGVLAAVLLRRIASADRRPRRS